MLRLISADFGLYPLKILSLICSLLLAVTIFGEASQHTISWLGPKGPMRRGAADTASAARLHEGKAAKSKTAASSKELGPAAEQARGAARVHARCTRTGALGERSTALPAPPKTARGMSETPTSVVAAFACRPPAWTVRRRSRSSCRRTRKRRREPSHRAASLLDTASTPRLR